ncbi:MAG TPA: aldehyde dehydrogenase family protein [Cytophagales bacterium]|nr:aldehyde dehydrogenase family protein [Cytophagales bacterium]HAA22537.1 aldehyde dehydrogenase family protein [Cytophagales bacterium]HAP64848.1 aldehyde dehydrogenase family protein [Cytophagales bacterium]
MATVLEQSNTNTLELIPQAFEAQKDYFTTRGPSSFSERIQTLKKLESWIVNHKEQIREALFSDFKKPHLETDITEILPVLQEVKHVKKSLRKWMRPSRVPTPITMLGSKAEVIYEPKGVTLIIAPWNYPFQLLVGPLISALAAGNTAVLKPSEMTPATARLISNMAREVFDPQEVVVFEGAVEVSEALLALPFDHIFFTGSPAVGKIVMRAAAEHLTSVTLELGGKSPVVLDETTLVKDAAEKLMWGKYLNNGQTCIAPDYALVPEKMVEPLVTAMQDSLKKHLDPEGEGIKNTGNYARIVNDRHYQRLTGALQEAVAAGAKVVVGGETDDQENYLSPTVVVDAPEDISLLNDEIFGPILPIRTYKEIDDAIDYINKKPKPLALYYFGKENQRKRRLLSRTSSGGVVSNDVILHFAHAELPFGGVNNSGIGKAHGKWGFMAFSNEKGTLHQNRNFSMAKMTYPPYSNRLRKMMDTMMKYL